MSRDTEILILDSLRLLLVAQNGDRTPGLADQIDQQIKAIDLDLHPPALPRVKQQFW